MPSGLPSDLLLGKGEKAPTPTLSVLLRKRPVLLNGLTEGDFVVK